MGNDNPADFLNLNNGQPLPPAAPAKADDTPVPENELMSGSFSERMKQAADKIGVAPGVGGWAQSLVAAGMEALGAPKQPTAGNTVESQAAGRKALDQATSGDITPDTKAPVTDDRSLGLRALSGVRGILGDAAAGAEAGGGHRGALTGVLGTERAGAQREKETMNNRILTAKANAEMLHQQRLMHEMDQKMMDSGAESGQKALATIESAPAPGQTMYRDQNSDQLHELLAQGKIDPTTQTVFHTGNVIDGKDANGVPRYRATYSVVTLGGPVTLDEDQATRLNKYLKPATPIKAGQVLDSPVFNSMSQTADNAQTFQDAMSYAREKAGVEKGKLDKEADHLAIAKDPDVQNALSTAMIDGGDKSYAPIRAFNALQQNKAFMTKHPSFDGPTFFGDEKGWNELNHDFRTATGKSTGVISEIAKDPTKLEGHTSSVMAAAQNVIDSPTSSPEEKAQASGVLKQAKATRQLEIDMEGEKDLKKAQVKEGAKQRTNPNNLTGEAFIATLPAGRAAALRAINEGSLSVNASALERTDKGQAFMDDIYAAYPDFKAYRGMEWPKVFQDYYGSGKIAAALVRANTAVEHAAALFDETTASAMLNPLSSDHQKRAVTLGLFKDEIGAAVKGGVLTEGEGHELLENIGGGYTVGNKRERIQEVSRRLNDRIQAQQDKLDDAKPSQYIKTAPLFSDRARKAYDYVQNGGSQADKNNGPTGNGGKLLPNQPPNTTYMKLPAGQKGPDGSDHMFVKNDLVETAKQRGATVIQ